MSDMIVLAKLGKSHALKGWQLLHSSTNPPEQIKTYEPLFIQYPNQDNWQPCNADIRQQSGKLLIKLDNTDTPEAAKLNTHALIAVERCQLPDADQDTPYWHDLVDCQVINQKNELLGTVKHVFNAGADDILALDTPDTSRERLIPFNKNTIYNIDLKEKIITANWELDW